MFLSLDANECQPPEKTGVTGAFWRWWDRKVNSYLAKLPAVEIEHAPGSIAADLHIHSHFSKCSMSRTEDVITTAVKRGLMAIAVMDHNDICGSLAAESTARKLKDEGRIPQDFLVIGATEVRCDKGHIGALFVEEDIEPYLSVEKTVDNIHNAGGLAVVVHPYHSSGIGDSLHDADFDCVEIVSGGVYASDLRARAEALKNDGLTDGMARIASSDAHYLGGIGACFTVIETTDCSKETVKHAIAKGRCVPQTTETYDYLCKKLCWIGKLR